MNERGSMRLLESAVCKTAVVIFSLLCLVWMTTVTQSQNEATCEYEPQHKFVVAKKGSHLKLEPLKPHALVRIVAEPLIALAFIVGTADTVCSATLIAFLIIAPFMVAWVACRGISIGNLLNGLLTSFMLSAQVFTMMCWLSFYAPTMRYRAEKKGCIVANFHAHTYRSSGLFSPAKVVEWHRKRGFKVIAITDTNTVSGGIEALRYAQKRGYKILIIVGEELHARTHVLLLNISKSYSPKEGFERAIEGAKSSGGVVIVAHPWTAHHKVDKLFKLADGFEVINRNIICDDITLWQRAYGKRPLIASNDFKFGAHSFTATCLHGDVQSVEDVCEALRVGRTLPITWLKHKLVNPKAYESRTLRDKVATLSKAIQLYFVFFDAWAAIGWLLFLLVTALALKRGKHVLKCSYRARPMRMTRKKPAFLLASYLIGLLLIAFGIAWTWSPTLKVRLKYNPAFVVILWFVGDLLLLRYLRTEHVARRSNLRLMSWRF
ncbi:MAG: hypothetical protein RUDDFDWM_000031 [Candidatus Fervidibacterota bacterium]